MDIFLLAPVFLIGLFIGYQWGRGDGIAEGKEELLVSYQSEATAEKPKRKYTKRKVK